MQVMCAVAKLPNYLNMFLKTKSVQKLTELGPYMDVSVQPARKVRELSVQQHKGIVAVNICLLHMSQISPPGVTSTMEEESQFLDRQVRVSRAGSFCSSDTSFDSSVSSDLEVGSRKR